MTRWQVLVIVSMFDTDSGIRADAASLCEPGREPALLEKGPTPSEALADGWEPMTWEPGRKVFRKVVE